MQFTAFAYYLFGFQYSSCNGSTTWSTVKGFGQTGFNTAPVTVLLKQGNVVVTVFGSFNTAPVTVLQLGGTAKGLKQSCFNTAPVTVLHHVEDAKLMQLACFNTAPVTVLLLPEFFRYFLR